jgi:hypothetical protein
LYQNKTSVGVLGMPKTPLNSIRGHISCLSILTVIFGQLKISLSQIVLYPVRGKAGRTVSLLD